MVHVDAAPTPDEADSLTVVMLLFDKPLISCVLDDSTIAFLYGPCVVPLYDDFVEFLAGTDRGGPNRCRKQAADGGSGHAVMVIRQTRRKISWYHWLEQAIIESE